MNNWDSILHQHCRVPLGKTCIVKEKNKKFTSKVILIATTKQVGLKYKTTLKSNRYTVNEINFHNILCR